MELHHLPFEEARSCYLPLDNADPPEALVGDGVVVEAKPAGSFRVVRLQGYMVVVEDEGERVALIAPGAGRATAKFGEPTRQPQVVAGWVWRSHQDST